MPLFFKLYTIIESNNFFQKACECNYKLVNSHFLPLFVARIDIKICSGNNIFREMDEENKKDVAGPILEIKGCYFIVPL